MGLEKWLAVTSLALFFMFIGQMITLYLFMTEVPEDIDVFDFEPNPKILQFISISVAPAGILAGLAFLMSRRYGSKLIGYLIIAGGVVQVSGMAYCYTIVDRIETEYLTDMVVYTPILFIVLSIPIFIVGASLLKLKKRRPKKEYF